MPFVEKEPYKIKNNFAACVILYNPTDDNIKNIDTYLSKVSELYVYDNTETKSNENLFKEHTNIHYYWDGENKGLSIRLNQACERALKSKFEYLLTMDQDSSFLEENIDQYFRNILSFPTKEEVAVYGLEYIINGISDITPNFSEVDHLITSGSVLNLKIYNEIGGFDENLFIDVVDIDYCYSALTKGFKNIKFGKIFFEHSLGEPVKSGSIYSLYLIKKNKVVHSPLRIYYMCRNILYLEEKYTNKIPDNIKKLKQDYKHHIKKCIKYSDDFFKILRYKRRAIEDFNNKKMGKFQP